VRDSISKLVLDTLFDEKARNAIIVITICMATFFFRSTLYFPPSSKTYYSPLYNTMLLRFSHASLILRILWIAVGTTQHSTTAGFVVSGPGRAQNSCSPLYETQQNNNDNNNNNNNNNNNKGGDDNNHKLHRQLQDRSEQIQVEKARTSLEEQNTKSFLKKRPLKLPYEAARKWVQANLGADTQQEHDDLVENGNLRTPYIPKRPEEYYTATREWISWDHYLKGCFDDHNPSNVRPPTGMFD
jgi:hypothetical protein